jgi:hypothetical protein
MRLETLFPIIIPIIAVAVMIWRARRPQRLRVARMWIVPALLVPFIGMGLWFAPHPAASPLTLAVLPAALLAGVAFGISRARLTRLTRTADGTLMAQVSALGTVLLLALFALRGLLRTQTGAANAPATILLVDGLMLFAVGMIVANRITLWRRAVAMPG